jgi:citrate synthase
LHGLANQEVLKWVLDLKKELGEEVTEEKIKEFVLQTIAEGKVVPGYGHAVLRHTDPRFLHLKAFADKYIKNDPLVELVSKCFHAIPPTLKSIAKIQNPWP